MYTKLVNVQIIVSLLKQHGVRRLVLSPGNRDVPLVHSVESDADFECYSIVDERSAAFFALGLAESTGEAAGVVCTSSTASCNFMPAIQEAAERHIKLIALTADRENYLLYQFEDQKICQTDMYAPYTKCSADLPVVRNELDKWLCIRKVNEALLALDGEAPGPVQINFQVNRTNQFPVKKLPEYRKIDRITESKFSELADDFRKKLAGKERILVIVGEWYKGSDELTRLISEFRSSYGAVIISDHFSNMNGLFLNSIIAIETMTDEDFTRFAPDLVITIGGHIWSGLKYRLRASKADFEHWRIAPDDVLRDGFKRLVYTFDFEPEVFFKSVNTDDVTDSSYHKLWKDKIDSIKFPELKFSNFSVIKKIVGMIPQNSVVHTSILNSARLNSFSKYSESNIKTYCNFGADGIDGCMSTFLGQANDNGQLSFLITGDLSFLYDLNAAEEIIGADKRILLINNHAGSEFHTTFGLAKFKTLNSYIAAGHNTDICDYVDTERFMYLSASNKEDLDREAVRFVGKSDKPIIFEVFTDAKRDGEVLNKFYELNNYYPLKMKLEMKAKSVVKKLLKI